MASAKRILIVTNGHPCRNPRPVKEAFTLAKAGHAVTLLYVRNHPPSLALDKALLEGAPFRTECVDLLDGSRSRGQLIRIRTGLARRLNGLGANLIEALGPAPELLRAARNHAADLTIVHNEISHWAGCRLVKEGRRVAADLEDWHSEDLLPEARAARPLRRLRAIERSLLHATAYCSTTSEALASGLHERYGGVRPAVITNSFPLQPLPNPRSVGGVPSFFWFSQTIGPGRGLEAFVNAWSLCRGKSRLVLLGEIAPEYRSALLALVAREKTGDVEFLPIVPVDALPEVIARHDIGLALEDATIPNRNLTITNKILQYLNAGLAVVASVTEGQREVLGRSPEAGMIVELGNAPMLARQLDALIEDRERLAVRQAAARTLAETHYCWEREEPRLVALVEAALR